MDPYTIGAIALGAALALSGGLWIRTRIYRGGAIRRLRDLTDRLAVANASIQSLRLGEREAAWAATAAGERLRTALLELSKARHEILRLRDDLAALGTRLTTAEQNARALESQQSEAAERIGRLEAELRGAHDQREQVEREHRDEVEGLAQRLAAVVKERDHLGAAALRTDEAEAELAALGRVHQELAEARAEIEVLRSRVEAAPAPNAGFAELVREIDDLRSQLAARSEAAVMTGSVSGHASPDKVGQPPPYAEWDETIRVRVAQAVEESTRHLRTEVSHLRLVVAEKERRLQRSTRTAAPPAPAELPVTVIKGIGPAIARILAEHGIVTVAHIAALDEAMIDRLGAAMPVYPGRIRHDDWVGQARTLTGL